MKFSEAIRIGIQKFPEKCTDGNYFSSDGKGACIIGVAVHGLRIASREDSLEDISELLDDELIMPRLEQIFDTNVVTLAQVAPTNIKKGLPEHILSREFYNLSAMLICLNDHTDTTRGALADWMKSIDL